jgi:hypothetical protein
MNHNKINLDMILDVVWEFLQYPVYGYTLKIFQ